MEKYVVFTRNAIAFIDAESDEEVYDRFCELYPNAEPLASMPESIYKEWCASIERRCKERADRRNPFKRLKAMIASKRRMKVWK